MNNNTAEKPSIYVQPTDVGKTLPTGSLGEEVKTDTYPNRVDMSNREPVVTENIPINPDDEGRIIDPNVAHDLADTEANFGRNRALNQEKKLETGMTEEQKTMSEVMEGLEKKYPDVFTKLVTENGQKILIVRDRAGFSAMSTDGVLSVMDSTGDIFKSIDPEKLALHIGIASQNNNNGDYVIGMFNLSKTRTDHDSRTIHSYFWDVRTDKGAGLLHGRIKGVREKNERTRRTSTDILTSLTKESEDLQ